jgi:catechol 2,3-dioxygenase-like lactoylglutathione lyase family enzyme
VTVTGIGNVVLLVRDLQRSRSFYEDVLGLEAVRDEYVNAAIHLGRDGTELLSLYEVTDKAPLPRTNSTAYFRVTWTVADLADLDRVEQGLRAHGGWGGRGPQNARATGLGTAYGADPDGNRLEVRWTAEDARSLSPGDGT